MSVSWIVTMQQLWGGGGLNITPDKGRKEDANWKLNVPKGLTDRKSFH